MDKRLILALVPLLIFSVTPKPVYAEGSFTFYCSPEAHPYIPGNHYIAPGSPYTPCYLTLPADVSLSDVYGGGVYRGTPGTGVGLGGYFNNVPDNNKKYTYHVDFGEYELVNEGTEQETNVRHEPKEGDDFYASIFIRDVEHTVSWKWGSKPASEYDPVIIIPGILGSWEKNGVWVLDPLAHTYDNLVNTFLANGYIKDKTLFTLPYDWRKSNVETANLLAQKVEQVKTVCNCSYVDIIAHSMGGLVATQYIMNKPGLNDVDQLFLLGTPLFGSPRAYKAWESGEMDFGDIRINTFLTRIFSREATDNGYSSIFDYIRNKPISSIQELLPINYNYLTKVGAVLEYPNGYPRNPFLENLVGNIEAFVNKIYDQTRTYIITGDLGTQSTPIGYTVKDSTQLPKWEHGEIISTIRGQGDGTVPHDSSTYFSGPDKNYPSVKHIDIASSSSPYIFQKLNYKSVSTIVGKIPSLLDIEIPLILKEVSPSPTEFKNFLNTLKEAFWDDWRGRSVLLLTLFSPIDVQVTAPDGKKLGRDFAGGADLNQIPNAIYSGPLDEYEYIMILDPLPGEYKVETKGTGNGAYTVAAGRIDSATTSASLVSGITTLSQLITNTLFYSSTSTTVTLTPSPAPIATSTPTTTVITPDTCVTDITAAYKTKWIGKKFVYEKLVFDCTALKELFKTRDKLEAIPEKKRKPTEKLLLVATYAGIRLTLADMELLAKDRGNTKDAVLLITKITTWFKNHEVRH